MEKNKNKKSSLPAGVSQNGKNIPPIGFWGKVGRLCVRAISHLPLRVLYVGADITYFILYRLLGYRKKVVRANLHIVFPEKSEAELRDIERRFYHHLSDYFFETIKAATISDEELTRRIVIRNPEVVTRIMDKGQNVFIYAAHFGNWEWFTCWPLIFPNKYEIHTFYQAQDNRFANYITVEMRTRRNIIAVESHRGFRYTFQSQKEGVVSATLIIGDQSPHYGAQKMWIPFCGRDTAFLVGPEHIARKLGIALVYPSFVEYHRGHYEVEFRVVSENPAAEPEKECTKRFAKYLEEDLHHIPELWLWSHNRWKHKHEDFPDEK